MADWNCHRLRKNVKSCLPAGIPNDLYDMPEFYGKLKFILILIHTIMQDIQIICLMLIQKFG